jgi:hypothetical protein
VSSDEEFPSMDSMPDTSPVISAIEEPLGNRKVSIACQCGYVGVCKDMNITSEVEVVAQASHRRIAIAILIEVCRWVLRVRFSRQEQTVFQGTL